MKAVQQLATWVNPAMHAQVKALAQQRGVSVSCLLAELVEEMLDEDTGSVLLAPTVVEARRDYLTIRLRPGDITAVGKRSKVRRMKPSTYIAALVRSHLVQDPPLPPAELAALERATAELSAIGRNLNQLARAVNAGAPAPVGTASIVGRSVEAVEAVREATKDYVRKAVAGWEAPLG